jgi:gluconate 2-dehydrogenase gamma chain
MDTPRQPDRRSFIQRLGALAGGSVLAAQMPALLATMDLACVAQDAGAPLRVFDPVLAEFVEAFAARIIPTDHRPGAREAGVVRFIDMVIDTMPPFAGADGLLRETMQQLADEAGEPFHLLSDERQDELLRNIESSDGFGVMQLLTVAGFLTHPKWGGNQGKVGWKLIGFDDRHVWAPPFGYYDAQLMESEGGGA